MNQDYKELKECVCCDSENLKMVLDFNEQPLANNSLKTADEVENVYPLKLNYCSDCTHLQLKHAVNPDLMFRQYLYVSGTSQTLKDYFRWFAKYTSDYVGEKNNGKILDIACNDGTLLDVYSNIENFKYQTYGIDPSVNLHKVSSIRHTVELDYLNWNYAKKNKNMFSTIVAQNVMAHNSYPKEFLEMCKMMLVDDGYIFIQNSQADMVKNNEFDTIYHEHISFYSIKSFKTLARQAGLIVVDVKKVPIHGNSNIFVLSKNLNILETNIVDEFVLNDVSIHQYAYKCYKVINELTKELEKLRKENYKIVGYGSAAKGNTLINASNIKLDYIVDDNPLKQGLFTPGARIPIVSILELEKETDKLCVIPLAWNFFDEIKQKCLTHINVDDLIFVKYFPQFKIIEEQNSRS
jgi:2-polyprenyl-3-methyl-5-hydroxy-6-metoxy-1,4-benzoquinol methylase